MITNYFRIKESAMSLTTYRGYELQFHQGYTEIFRDGEYIDTVTDRDAAHRTIDTWQVGQ